MARGRQVTIQFLGDAKGLIGATNAAGRSTSTLGSKLKSAGKIAAVGLAAGTVFAAKALWDMTEAAIEDEKAQAQLANQLRQGAKATDAQIKSAEAWIDTQQRALGIADDELRPALAKLATATGDVGEAQRLLSLAMDVAAGSGKSLDTVTMSLVRAVNGSVSGLSRLGVQTKTTAGETMTLEQVTDSLAKKYRGAASTAAETAAGKFARLKISLAETGEEIGAKVLPYATDLGEWMLSEGIPAVEDLAGWVGDTLGPALADLSGFVRENKDEFQDLAEQGLEQTVDLLRDAGEVVGTAVDLFRDLPGPVRSLGIEAGIAAIVLPRLATGLTAAGTSATLFATNLGNAETRSRRLNKSLLTLAGIGGMVAITEGASEGSEAVTVLGSALTGAFVGGTLGSAIPGVGTAIGAVGGAAVGTAAGLYKVHKQADNAGDSAGDATPRFDGLKETLNQVTGASTRATKAFVLQRLEQDGIVESAGQLGIATSDLIAASLGNQRAIRRVNQAWEAQGTVLEGIQNQKISDWIRGMRTELGKSRRDIQEANAALRGTDKDAKKAGNALRKVGTDRPKTDIWRRLYTGDLMKAQDATDERTQKIREMLRVRPGEARTNMGPFTNDLITQLGRTKDRAGNAAAGIGNTMESNLLGGFGGIIQGVANTVQQAINQAQAQANNASNRGGGGRPRATSRGGMVVAPRGAAAPRSVAVGSQPIVIQFVTQGGQVIEQKLIQWSRDAGRPIQVQTL